METTATQPVNNTPFLTVYAVLSFWQDKSWLCMIVLWLNCMSHPQYRCSHISEKEGQPASYTQCMHRRQRITYKQPFSLEQGLQFSEVCSRTRQQVSIRTGPNWEKLIKSLERVSSLHALKMCTKIRMLNVISCFRLVTYRPADWSNCLKFLYQHAVTDHVQLSFYIWICLEVLYTALQMLVIGYQFSFFPCRHHCTVDFSSSVSK